MGLHRPFGLTQDSHIEFYDMVHLYAIIKLRPPLRGARSVCHKSPYQKRYKNEGT